MQGFSGKIKPAYKMLTTITTGIPVFTGEVKASK